MTKKNIPYINLGQQWAEEREDLLKTIDEVLSTGNYIGGYPVDKFESSLGNYCGSNHCISLNSGTDALIYSLIALGIGPGDEVITVPNSFIASTAAIIHVGAQPVFIDVLPDQNLDPDLIEGAITPKTKAIMPVHLTGRVCKMDRIMRIAKKYDLKVIEDCAQAIGSEYMGKKAGTFGDIGCFSAHPLKNLNACGDAGYAITNSSELAEKIKLLRGHGLVDRNTANFFGYVSRLDPIQAVILDYRLDKIDALFMRRRSNAALYRSLLNVEKVFFPKEEEIEFNTYHTFVIQIDNRDKIQSELLELGIGTAIHYPVPIHLQPAAQKIGYKSGNFPVAEAQSKKILSLPIHQYLSEEDVRYVSDSLNKLVQGMN